MTDTQPGHGAGVVVVGAGLAGAKMAQALRDRGYAQPVTLIGAETDLPYERPPLSKSYLAGSSEFDAALVHPGTWYAEHEVALLLGVTATAIHRDRHEVELSDGRTVGYAHLVLATGSEPVRPAILGADAPGVLTLRSRSDSDRLRAVLRAGQPIVIIGAGWLGLEVAAAAQAAGCTVTVVEAAGQPLQSVVGAELGAFFADLHRNRGVDLRTQAQPTQIAPGTGSTFVVRLAGGDEIPADTVLLATGARPLSGLARDAGLPVDDGVIVDSCLCTPDPAIFAVGDIARHSHPVLGTSVRVEHWAAALNQPDSVAATILGEPTEYSGLPYFFSDQYDVGLEYVGYVPHVSGDIPVVRGDLEGGEFVAFWLDPSNAILAAMNVNVWDVPDAVQPLIVAGKAVDPAALADPAIPLTEL